MIADARRIVAPKDEESFTTRFCRETQKARQTAGLTQAKIAEELGISPGRYKNYESRSTFPMELLPAFCLAVGLSPTAFLNRVLTSKRDQPSD